MVLTACGEAGAGSADAACDEAMDLLYTGESSPGTLAHELERIAEGGNAETRAIFDPTIKRLRRLGPADVDPAAPDREGGLIEVVTPVLDDFVAACGRPVE